MSGAFVPREWVSERGLLVTFDDADLGAAVARSLALVARLRAARPAGVEDVVPGAGSVLVLARPGAEDGLEYHLAPLLAASAEAADTRQPGVHVLDVTYDGDDLADVAREAGLSIDEAVSLHAGATYTVAFLGFAPGFPYLVGLPAALERPRRASPRASVPAGSVAIAGPFCGVYPFASPGGWRILGRTSAPLFRPHADPPCRLAAGDRVRFVAR